MEKKNQVSTSAKKANTGVILSESQVHEELRKFFLFKRIKENKKKNTLS